MYIAKRRGKSPTLLVMISLSRRFQLDREGWLYLKKLGNGDLGEEVLWVMACGLSDRVIGFPDMLLDPLSSGLFQWDLILLCDRTFYLYEAKNVGGAYQYGAETFNGKNGFNMKNPLIQMTDNKVNFEQLLKKLGFDGDFDVKAYTVMVNPEFTLFGMPHDVPILLHSQLPEHFRELDRGLKPLNGLHRKVMEALLASQGEADVFWKYVPPFTYDDLQKGACCEGCGGFSLAYSRQMYDCKECTYRGKIALLIEANIVELRRLFPQGRITTEKICEWFGGVFPPHRIRRAIKSLK